MRFSLAPREVRFFDMFEASVEVVLKGARLFSEMLHDYTDTPQKAKAIKTVELEGDQNTHQLMDALNRSFMTPIDRDDICALNSGLDDILDCVEALASRMVLFKIQEPTPEMCEFADLLLEAVEHLAGAVHSLRKMDTLMLYCREVKRLENLGDDLSRKVISDLFEKEGDPIRIIKLKEIYGRMESAMDRCEDVANIIETIFAKNG
ncbi:MAG: DUF47 family protein [Acidobacteriota bacterium]